MSDFLWFRSLELFLKRLVTLFKVSFLTFRCTRSTFNPPQDRESVMKNFQCLPVFLAVLSATVEGWSCLPPSPVKKIRDISRKSFLIGAASGLVIGTTATAAGAAVAADRANASNKFPYEPPAGSLTDKVILITGGSAGLGLVRTPSGFFFKKVRWERGFLGSRVLCHDSILRVRPCFRFWCLFLPNRSPPSAWQQQEQQSF